MVHYLNWPKQSTFSVRMTKKIFEEQYDSADKKALSDVTKMEWKGSLKRNHASISTFINDEYYYDEINYIEITLKSNEQLQKIASMFQKAIPYPLVIGFVFDNDFCLQVCEKKIHQQQKDKRVLGEKLYFTDWFPNDTKTKKQELFLNGLNLINIGGKNLKEYYDGLISYINNEEKQLRAELDTVLKEISAIRNKYAKEKSAGKKAELNNQAVAISQRKKIIEEKLKNL